ncbi:MAG: ribosome maturation factor RimP [Ruthenibacterium sp.]
MAKNPKKEKGGTVVAVEQLITPVLADMGLRLWDVRFEKEGPDWFLRIFIDRDEPLDLDLCEAAARAVNPVIDAADPIEQSYYMELGSPGLGRRLTKDAHFKALCGQKVLAHLIRAGEDGEKDVTGTLLSKDGTVLVLDTENGAQPLDMANVSYVKLCDDEDLF